MKKMIQNSGKQLGKPEANEKCIKNLDNVQEISEGNNFRPKKTEKVKKRPEKVQKEWEA